MKLSAYALASGSSGNAILIRSGETGVLLDAGLSGRELVLRMKAVGFDPVGLRGVVISHEHTDHIQGAGTLARKLRIPLIATQDTLKAARPRVGSTDVIPLPPGETLDLSGLLIRSFSIPHDAVDPVGFVFEAGRHRICSATDIGVPSPEIQSAMVGSQLVILESNYDVKSLMTGPYPEYLKRRIYGPEGHLSNREASQLISNHLKQQGPTCFWLAHLSKTNNSPQMALETTRKELQQEGLLEQVHLEVAHRDRISAKWHAGAIAWQRSLF
jgi:phosphoribosyl 1,2-cyclic phosphodiesterase